MEKVNLTEKFALFSEYWSPKIVAELNDQVVKIAKIKGEFVWHSHKDEDELFMVIKGRMRLKLRDRDVDLNEGELFVVPRGVEHKPVAEKEVHLLLFEPSGTVNTGEVRSKHTVTKNEWI